MHEDVEFFADTILMLIMTVVAVALMQADPLLPALWVTATVFMTMQHR